MNQLSEYLYFSNAGYVDGHLVKKVRLVLLGFEYEFYGIQDKVGRFAMGVVFDKNSTLVKGEKIRDLEKEMKITGYLPYDVAVRKIELDELPKFKVSFDNQEIKTSCIVASAGRVIAPIKFSSENGDRSGILVKNVIEMEDVDTLLNSEGFIVTDGASLSHPYITAREHLIPGVINHFSQITPQGLVLKYDTYTPRKFEYNGVEVIAFDDVDSEEVLVKEGDLLDIDTETGTIKVIEEGLESDIKERLKHVYKLIYRSVVEADEESLNSLVSFCLTDDQPIIAEMLVNKLYLDSSLDVSQNVKQKVIGSLLENERLTDATINYVRKMLFSKESQLKITAAEMMTFLKGKQYGFDEMYIRYEWFKSQMKDFEKFYRSVSDAAGNNAYMFSLGYSNVGKRLNFNEIQVLYDSKVVLFKEEFLGEIRLVDSVNRGNEAQAKRLWMKAELIGLDRTLLDYQNFRFMRMIRRRQVYNDFLSGNNLIINLQDAGTHVRRFVGNKAAELGEMINMDIPYDVSVPEGFVVTTLGIEHLINSDSKLKEALVGIQKSDMPKHEKYLNIKDLLLNSEFTRIFQAKLCKQYHKLEQYISTDEAIAEVARIIDLSTIQDKDLAHEALRVVKETLGEVESLQDVILSMGLPEEVLDNLNKTYVTYGGVSVAVRSTSFVEDTITTAAAGRFKTEVRIQGVENLFNSILRCSAFYWAEYGELYPCQPIIVQKFISGDNVIVNSVDVNRKSWATEIEVGGNDVQRSGLDKETVQTIRNVSDYFHQMYGYPLNYEISVRDGKVYMIQLRPITGFFKQDPRWPLSPLEIDNISSEFKKKKGDVFEFSYVKDDYDLPDDIALWTDGQLLNKILLDSTEMNFDLFNSVDEKRVRNAMRIFVDYVKVDIFKDLRNNMVEYMGFLSGYDQNASLKFLDRLPSDGFESVVERYQDRYGLEYESATDRFSYKVLSMDWDAYFKSFDDGFLKIKMKNWYCLILTRILKLLKRIGSIYCICYFILRICQKSIS